MPTPAPPLLLASASPRRRELLAANHLLFDVQSAEIDESRRNDEAPDAYVLRLATSKAQALADSFPYHLILGADTIVVLDGQIFGKPADLAEAQTMLAKLSARTHHVLTGVCLLPPGEPPLAWVSKTEVTFKLLTAEVIRLYFSLVSPLDKAGAYAIQEHGELLVSSYCGLLSNVIGLPVEVVLQRLASLYPDHFPPQEQS